MSLATKASLPTVDQRPTADVVIYDGDCRICTRQVERLARWDRWGRLAFLSLHDPEVSRRYPDLSHEAMMREMYAVDRRGRRYRGAAAVRRVATRLPRLWPVVPLLFLPLSLPLWQWLYQQVARRRYLFGRTEVCENDACSLHRYGSPGPKAR